MECYACDREAIGRCERCGNPFCAEHGEGDLCQACLNPANVLPSSTTFRGSLLVLLLGSVLALWLLVRPPDLPGGAVSNLEPLPTQQIEFTPVPRTSPVPSPTPTPTLEPSPTPSPTPQVTLYTVKSGDSLLSIAQANLPAGRTAFDYAHDIASANSLNYDNAQLHTGQVLTLP